MSKRRGIRNRRARRNWLITNFPPYLADIYPFPQGDDHDLILLHVHRTTIALEGPDIVQGPITRGVYSILSDSECSYRTTFCAHTLLDDMFSRI